MAEKYNNFKIEDIINEIAEYENLAKTMLEETRADAGSIIADADKKGREFLETREKEADKEAQRILEEAEAKADRKNKEIIKAAKKRIEKLQNAYSQIEDEIIEHLIDEILT